MTPISRRRLAALGIVALLFLGWALPRGGPPVAGAQASTNTPTPTTAPSDYVYVVTASTIYRTANFTSSSPTWTNVTGDIDGHTIIDFEFDPLNENVAYVSTEDVLYKTTNLTTGPTWNYLFGLAETTGTGYTATHLGPVEVSAADDGLVAVLGRITGSTNIALYKSTNGGSTWAATDTGAKTVESPIGADFAGGVGFALSPNDPDNIYIGVATGILRSLNGGASFSQVYTNSGEFYGPHQIVVPANDNATDSLVYWSGGSSSEVEAYYRKTTNGFSSTADISYVDPHAYSDGGGGRASNVGMLVVNPDDKLDIFGFAIRSVDKRTDEPAHAVMSDDGGVTWDLAHDFTSASGVQLVWGWPETRAYATGGNSTDGYILTSTDGGSTWVDKTGNWTVNAQIIFVGAPEEPAPAPTPTPTITPTPGPIVVSENYIRQGSFEVGSLLNTSWDTTINDPAIRMLLGLGTSPSNVGQDAVLWNTLDAGGAGCGSNAAIVLAYSPAEDFRAGTLAQDFQWPGGSMYLSFMGKTVGNTSGTVNLVKEDDSPPTLFTLDQSFKNPTSQWEVGRYVYNLGPGHYRIEFSATGTAGQFGWMAIDDVNVREGWFQGECNDAPPASGLIPAQQAPNFPTPIPYTPVFPTQWIHWASPTPLDAGPTATPITYPTRPRTPLAPPPDWPPGGQILTNGSFESFFNFLFWKSSRLSRVIRGGGYDGQSYALIDTGTKPPALSQHFDLRYPQPVYITLYANSNNHFTVAIRDAPAGIFRAVWREDTPITSGWQQYQYATAPLPAGQYSIEITNVYLRLAEIDEVCVSVGEYCTVTAVAVEDQQATATAYINYWATQGQEVLLTANAEATESVNSVGTAAAEQTRWAQTAAAGTLDAGQQATATAGAFRMTQTAQALQNSAAMTATAFWYQLSLQQTQAAATTTHQAQTAIAAQRTQSAQSTAFVQTQIAAFAELQTQVYLTAHAPAALTQTAQAIISTAQAPFHATQTAIAYSQTQIAATLQGTALATATTDVALATQQALVVPEQPEPYWAAVCGRPPNSLNLAWWIDYEVCRILSWFSWSSVNSSRVQTWQVEIFAHEPFGLLTELRDAYLTIDGILRVIDWGNTGACDAEVSFGDIFIPAQGILQGQFQFGPGPSIDTNCIMPVRAFLGDGISDGICGFIDILCKRGLLAWIQLVFDFGFVMMFLVYLQLAWIAKATQG